MRVFCLMLAIFAVTSSLRPVPLAKTSFLARTRRVIQVEYFENCNNSVYPLMPVGLSFGRNGTNLVIRGELVASRDIKSPIKMEIRLEKCTDKSNPDTCEYYTTWRWDDMCASFKLPFVGSFMDAFTPPLTCPVKKNRYVLKGINLQADMLEMFLAYTQTITLWKFHVIEREGASVVVCLDFGIRLVATRVRS